MEVRVPVGAAQPGLRPHPFDPQDQSICLWRMNKAGKVTRVAQGSGHTHSVGAICCSRYVVRAGFCGVAEAQPLLMGFQLGEMWMGRPQPWSLRLQHRDV